MKRLYSALPSIRSKYFVLKSSGGVFEGIKGKPQQFEGSGLNNCVCGAWGMFSMLHGSTQKIGCGTRSTFTPYDAGQWYNLNTDLYSRGYTPKVGGVMVYKNHVAFVNGIYDNGDVELIESGYNNSSYVNGLAYRKVTKASGYYISGVAGTYLGCIYPNVEVECEETTTTSTITTEQAIQKMAEDVIKGIYGNGKNRSSNIYKAIQTKVNELMGE
jgi:surface antigen